MTDCYEVPIGDREAIVGGILMMQRSNVLQFSSSFIELHLRIAHLSLKRSDLGLKIRLHPTPRITISIRFLHTLGKGKSKFMPKGVNLGPHTHFLASTWSARDDTEAWASLVGLASS